MNPEQTQPLQRQKTKLDQQIWINWEVSRTMQPNTENPRVGGSTSRDNLSNNLAASYAFMRLICTDLGFFLTTVEQFIFLKQIGG